MDLCPLKLHLAAWTALSLVVSVFSLAVTVRDSELELCDDNDHVCVTDPTNCGARPPSSVQKTLNMSCNYQISADRSASVTCGWSQEASSLTEAAASLIFTSGRKILSCESIFNEAAVLNVTARMKNYRTGADIWSQPHTVHLCDAVKPSQPVLTVLGSTEDSLVVSWRSSSKGSCRLRYGLNSAAMWTQATDCVPAPANQMLTYTLKDLRPFTVYRAAVACRGRSGIWSDWSPDISGRTLDRAPSRPPEACYRVENTGPGGSLLLRLLWKAPDPREAGGRILGYQVSCEPGGTIQNVTEETALLVVEAGNYSTTVTAFNTAGRGPAAHLRIDTQRLDTLPSVRSLWVSSSYPGEKALRVQWKTPVNQSSSAPPVSHFAIQWRSEGSPATSRWSSVDGFNTSAVVQDLDPNESYLISVFPVYNQQCGPPQSVPASLQQGAMEVVNLKVGVVTKTTVSVVWAWQRMSGSIRVQRYSLMLRRDGASQPPPAALTLWPDRQQLTFFNLTPNTRYSLVLLADDVSRNTLPVTTGFDEVPAVATATPLLLLAFAVLIISVLSRTVYKSYFFPPISSPRGSTTGQWLMDPNHQRGKDRNVLDMEDLQVTDVLGEMSLIRVGPSSPFSSEDDLHQVPSLLPISRLIVKLSTLQLNAEYVSDAPQTAEQQLVSLQARRPDGALPESREADGALPESREADGALPESREADGALPESREADAALLQPMPEGNSGCPQKEAESRQGSVSQTSRQTEAAGARRFDELLADSHRGHQMTCEAEYVVHRPALGQTAADSGQTDGSYLTCETDYIANGCFRAETADGARSSDFSAA